MFLKREQNFEKVKHTVSLFGQKQYSGVLICSTSDKGFTGVPTVVSAVPLSKTLY